MNWHELSADSKAAAIEARIAAGDGSAAVIAESLKASRNAVIGICYRRQIKLPGKQSERGRRGAKTRAKHAKGPVTVKPVAGIETPKREPTRNEEIQRLWNEEGLNAGQIADRYGVDTNTITQLVYQLRGRGWKFDRRRPASVTAKAKQTKANGSRRQAKPPAKPKAKATKAKVASANVFTLPDMRGKRGRGQLEHNHEKHKPHVTPVGLPKHEDCIPMFEAMDLNGCRYMPGDPRESEPRMCGKPLSGNTTLKFCDDCLPYLSNGRVRLDA